MTSNFATESLEINRKKKNNQNNGLEKKLEGQDMKPTTAKF